MATASASPAAEPTPPASAPSPAILIENVQRFYAIYDEAHGHRTASQLQHDYPDPGSPGLHRLAELRNVTGASMAKAIATHPEIYVDAKALNELARRYPRMRIAPVTVAVGRGKPMGVTDASGVVIGLEALCAVNYLDPNVEGRFVHVLAHEYAHVQQALQSPAFYNDPKPTVP